MIDLLLRAGIRPEHKTTAAPAGKTGTASKQANDNSIKKGEKQMEATFREIDEKMNDILNKRSLEVSSINQLIAETKQERENAEKAMSDATNESDFEKYKAAKTQKENADDAMEMYTNRRKALEAAPLITAGEYGKTLEDITDILDALFESTKEDIIEHVEAIKETIDSAIPEFERGNKLIHKLQHKINQDDCIVRLESGKEYHDHTREKSYERFRILAAFYQQVVDSITYKTLKTK